MTVETKRNIILSLGAVDAFFVQFYGLALNTTWLLAHMALFILMIGVLTWKAFRQQQKL